MSLQSSEPEKIVVERGVHRNLPFENYCRAFMGLPELVEKEEPDPIIRQEIKVKALRKLAYERRSPNHWILNSEMEERMKEYKLQREILKQMKKEKRAKEREEKKMKAKKEKEEAKKNKKLNKN